MISYQEGTQVPSIVWKVIFRTPPPSDDTDSAYVDYNVSERLMNEPNIVDAADYRENLTYMNEIGIKLNNDNGFLTNDSGTGILDIDADIEVFIDGYYDIPDGYLYPIRKFGGWYDRSRLKNDPVRMSCEVVAYSYFGKAEKLNGLNVSRKYLDENGLRLYIAKLWVRDANLAGYELIRGTHYITSVFDTNPKAKLDDGEYVILTADAETVLSNADDTQRVKVFYTGFDHGDERVSTLIVKNVGQYPDTYYYYASINEVVMKCFEAIGVTSSEIQNYEIDTYDGRKILSGYNRVDNSLDTFNPIAIEFNGVDKYYISGAFTGLPAKNQIWEYDRTLNRIRLIYETTLNNRTHYKLIYDTDEERLIAFMDNVEDEDTGFIQLFVINESGATNTTLLHDTQYDTVNSYYRFHYSNFLKKFIYLGLDAGVKTMFELDLDGIQTPLITDSNLELNGFSCIYESGSTVIFYYIKDDSGTKKLYKRTYSTGWSETYVADWFDNANYNYWYGYKFVAEGKIFITQFDKSRFIDVSAGTFSAEMNPADTRLYSPYENNGKLYVIRKSTIDDTQKISSFESGVLTDESAVILPYDIVQNPSQFGFQQMCEFISTELAVLSKYPALMLRFASKFVPFLEGEYDTSGKTVRDVLQELSNYFLGYVRVSPEKKGYFVSRDNYTFDAVLEFKKDYIRERVTERVNNESYDRIEITNGRVFGHYGLDGIDVKMRRLELQFIPDEFITDYAKYYLDYYSTRRRIMRIKYLPTFYNFENLDQADLTDLGYSGAGKIHKVSPKKNYCEFEVII